MARPKKAPQLPKQDDDLEEGDRLEAKLEKISEMLEIARRIVEALETGAVVETEADADLNIEDALDAARELLDEGAKKV